MQTIKFIGKLISKIQIKELRRSPFWFFTMHLPHMIKCIYQALYIRPYYKNIYYNSKVYDGMTRNDFKKGNLIAFLGQIRAIRKFNYDDNPDGRYYWIGSLDDDN